MCVLGRYGWSDKWWIHILYASTRTDRQQQIRGRQSIRYWTNKWPNGTIWQALWIEHRHLSSARNVYLWGEPFISLRLSWAFYSFYEINEEWVINLNWFSEIRLCQVLTKVHIQTARVHAQMLLQLWQVQSWEELLWLSQQPESRLIRVKSEVCIRNSSRVHRNKTLILSPCTQPSFFHWLVFLVKKKSTSYVI